MFLLKRDFNLSKIILIPFQTYNRIWRMHASHISLKIIEHTRKVSQFFAIYYPIPNWKKFSRRLYKLYDYTIALPLSKFHFLQTISPLSSSNPTESSQGSSPLPSKRRKRPHSENHRLIMTNRAHVDVTERKKMSDPWEKKKKRKIKSVGSERRLLYLGVSRRLVQSFFPTLPEQILFEQD